MSFLDDLQAHLHAHIHRSKTADNTEDGGGSTSVIGASKFLEELSLVSMLANTPELPAWPKTQPLSKHPNNRFAEGDRLGRYIVIEELGRGGMGQVFEVFDTELRRRSALKIILTDRAISETRLARFVAEAQLTSQLEHPSIVPVYDFGLTMDGRFFYVMKKVQGSTLNAILRKLADGDAEFEREWSLHKLLGAFKQVCLAMAHAHERGVLHRDLKPANIMLGAFGEVLVLDWGLARRMGEPHEELGQEPIESVAVALTRDGAAVGTPGYMSPEQVRGELSKLDGRSDQWSLGAILYEILTLVRAYPNQEGSSSEGGLFSLLLRSTAGPPPHPTACAPERAVPPEIADVALKALSKEPSKRFDSVQAMANAVEAFLDGSRRRQQARALVARSAPLRQQASEKRRQARTLRQRAEEMLEAMVAWASVEHKRTAWALQDQAQEADIEAERLDVAFLQGMQGALHQAPELEEAHAQLAAYYLERHRAAEAARDAQAMTSSEAMLRMHDRGEHRRYLEGLGALSVALEPPGGTIVVHRFVAQDRRLVLQRQGEHQAPLHALELPAGSYLLELQAPGYLQALYPVYIERESHWDGIAPGSTTSTPIRLLRDGELTAQECYVPAGWFWAGGDNQAPNSMARQRVWLDAFIIDRDAVTNAHYIAFLDDVVAQGRTEEAMRHVPKARTGESGTQGAPIYGQGSDGRFYLREDAEGDLWKPHDPVCMISWFDALAYCQWRSDTTGLPWRLPWELEWEKAARGVDGRAFPWGDGFDPSFCNMRASGPRPQIGAVDAFPLDRSPYGVRGMGGNVRDWCRDIYRLEGPLCQGGRMMLDPDDGDTERTRIKRGGSYVFGEGLVRVCNRFDNLPLTVHSNLGFRCVRTP